MNTTKRKASAYKFEENFYKLMSHSAMGKTMESKRKRLVIEIVRTRTQLVAQTNKKKMKTYKIFNKDSAAITFKPRKIYRNKTKIVGATILDQSNRYIYWFHYKQTKGNFETLALYSDTDTSVYETEQLKKLNTATTI